MPSSIVRLAPDNKEVCQERLRHDLAQCSKVVVSLELLGIVSPSQESTLEEAKKQSMKLLMSLQSLQIWSNKGIKQIR